MPSDEMETFLGRMAQNTCKMSKKSHTILPNCSSVSYNINAWNVDISAVGLPYGAF
jgi:hypothetical protein